MKNPNLTKTEYTYLVNAISNTYIIHCTSKTLEEIISEEKVRNELVDIIRDTTNSQEIEELIQSFGSQKLGRVQASLNQGENAIDKVCALLQKNHQLEANKVEIFRSAIERILPAQLTYEAPQNRSKEQKLYETTRQHRPIPTPRILQPQNITHRVTHMDTLNIPLSIGQQENVERYDYFMLDMDLCSIVGHSSTNLVSKAQASQDHINDNLSKYMRVGLPLGQAFNFRNALKSLYEAIASLDSIEYGNLAHEDVNTSISQGIKALTNARVDAKNKWNELFEASNESGQKQNLLQVIGIEGQNSLLGLFFQADQQEITDQLVKAIPSMFNQQGETLEYNRKYIQEALAKLNQPTGTVFVVSKCFSMPFAFETFKLALKTEYKLAGGRSFDDWFSDKVDNGRFVCNDHTANSACKRSDLAKCYSFNHINTQHAKGPVKCLYSDDSARNMGDDYQCFEPQPGSKNQLNIDCRVPPAVENKNIAESVNENSIVLSKENKAQIRKMVKGGENRMPHFTPLQHRSASNTAKNRLQNSGKAEGPEGDSTFLPPPPEFR